MTKYRCLVCSYVYDEARGAPEEDVAAQTPWANLPVNWCCPECGAQREDFEILETP